MIRRRETKLKATPLDGIILAISPALIIGMIACLIFFLVIAFYRGQYDQRLIVILGLFTLAVVLIARISIESGRTYALTFSVPLAVVTLLAMFRFITVVGPLGPLSWLVNVGLLGVAWYLADRITYDCTLVDDARPSVQQGLLQSLGLLRRENIPQTAKTRSSPTTKMARKAQTRRHNPGAWVLYFALLAFPLFGIGQLVIPDEQQKQRAFGLLIGYLACALGLLTTTSFVGVRHYLRHRGVVMPVELSRAWLGYGAVGIFVILIACLALPLPGRSLGLVGLPFEWQSPSDLSASQWGWGSEGAGEAAQPSDAATGNPSEAQAATASDARQAQGADAQPGHPQAEAQGQGQGQGQGQVAGAEDARGEPSRSPAGNANEAAAQSSRPDAAPSQNSSGSRQPESKAAGEPQGNASNAASGEAEAQAGDPSPPGDQPEGAQASRAAGERVQEPPSEAADQPPPGQPPSPAASAASWLPTWLNSFPSLIKWLTILVLVGIVLLYVLTHPRELAHMFRQWLQWLSSWGRRAEEEAGNASAAERQSPQAKLTRRPFSEFGNPFTEAAMRGWPAERVVEYTFAALEAWAAEHGLPRRTEQTAAEFARQLERRQPRLQAHAVNAARLLDEQMFAARVVTRPELAPLAQLWRILQSS